MQIFERRWVYGHLLAGFMAVLFVFLGVWQFNRNTHKHHLEVRNKAAYAKPAPDVTSVTNPPDGSRLQATGTFDAAHESVLRNQVKNDNVGVDVLTPLRLSNGMAVIVDRGWVRASANSGVTTDPPFRGTSIVHGVGHASNPLGPLDTVNHLPDGRLAVPRVDLAAIGKTLPYKLLPVWIEAQAISPTLKGNVPALPQPPPPDPVNHMEYAIEWFAFALIPLIGWPYALRKFLRQRKPSTSSQTASPDSTTPVATRS